MYHLKLTSAFVIIAFAGSTSLFVSQHNSHLRKVGSASMSAVADSQVAMDLEDQSTKEILQYFANLRPDTPADSQTYNAFMEMLESRTNDQQMSQRARL